MSKKPIRFVDDASVIRAPRKGGKTFTFIDNTSIDPVVRQRIRSLVMRGRNVSSKDRAAEKPAKLQSGETDESEYDKQVALRQRKQWRKSNQWLPEPGAAFDMLSIPHAKHMTNDLKGLAYDFLRLHTDAVYPVKICQPSNSDNLWFDYFLHDEAFFHAWVASSVLAANLINGRDVTDVDSSFMHHFVKALRLINKHISSNNDTVDYVAIACVQVLLCISLMIDGPKQTKVHFEGLSRMVQLYGGLKGLEKSWFIIQEVQLFDLALAFQLGCPPILKPKLRPMETMFPYFSKMQLDFTSPLLDLVKDRDSEVYDAVKEVLKVTKMYNSRTKNTRIRACDFRAISTQLRYRLLDIHLKGNPFAMDPVTRAVYMGLNAHTVMYDVAFFPVGMPFKQFFEFMKYVLLDPVFQSTVDTGTYLWLLITSAISVASVSDYAWLAPRIKAVAAEYGRSDWGFIKEVLEPYPWIDCLHEEAGAEYWASVFEQQLAPPRSSTPGLTKFQMAMMKQSVITGAEGGNYVNDPRNKI